MFHKGGRNSSSFRVVLAMGIPQKIWLSPKCYSCLIFQLFEINKHSQVTSMDKPHGFQGWGEDDLLVAHHVSKDRVLEFYTAIKSQSDTLHPQAAHCFWEKRSSVLAILYQPNLPQSIKHLMYHWNSLGKRARTDKEKINFWRQIAIWRGRAQFQNM